MPAKSKAQQKATGAGLSAKRGETFKRDLNAASESIAETISEKEFEELAATERKCLPDSKD